MANIGLQRTRAARFASALAAEAGSFRARAVCRVGAAVFFTAFVSSAADGPIQSQASFEAAVRNHSTAPPYVLITVVDEKAGKVRSGCTTVNAFMGAIHMEYGLGYDPAGEARATDIALTSQDHVFKFKNRRALENIAFAYSGAVLNEIRGKLSGLSEQQLRDGIATSGSLHELYQGKRPWQVHDAYRDALACVLIERGLSPGMGDPTDQLWVAK